MKFVFNNPDTVKESKEPDCSVNGSNSTAVSADTVLEIEYSDLLADYGDKSFHDTSSLKPRSFASMQLRARNAIRSLIRNQNAKLLLLCGSSSVNVIDIAFELVTEITGKEPVTAYAPTKYECFGDDKNDGVFTSSNIVIMPCNHLIDHPKWLGMVNACLAQNNSLKLILCGDATECAGLSLLWPVLDNAISSDIVQEFSAKGGLNLIGSLVKSYESRYSLKPFSVEAVDLLCLWASRQAGDRRYLCILEQKLINFCIEASFYAKDKTVKRHDVLKAIGADDFRLNYLSESELRNHRDHQIFIATKGEVIGQINGLSVIETTGTSYEYGEPVRITATLRVGGEGDVIDIERKAELAGQIHAKAMMIINGFLTKEFGTEQPLPLSASLVFEQSYSEIDGDSASLTGLCAVISALSELPVRQDLAVTGAVDQFGDVQPVGGVNEKIEGFFRLCRLHGLTGTQGVVIPASCIHQLVLRPAVLKAIKEGKFHIYAVGHVTSAAKVLLKTPWGDEEQENSICAKISERIEEISPMRQEKSWWHFWKF